MKTEYGPWRLSSAAADRVRCYRPDCDQAARWSRTWRTPDMRAPEWQYACDDHAEGRREKTKAAGAQEAPGSGHPARSSPGLPPSPEEER